jgi:hypothetical protein
MKQETKYISLKEAAEMSGYSSDYVGYLIRTGKISGKPAYTNIVWQTTAEEVLNYKNREGKRKKKEKRGFMESFFEFLFQRNQRIIREIRLLKLFIKTFRFFVPVIIVLVLSFSVLVAFIISDSFGKEKAMETSTENTSENISQPLKY